MIRRVNQDSCPEFIFVINFDMGSIIIWILLINFYIFKGKYGNTQRKNCNKYVSRPFKLEIVK